MCSYNPQPSNISYASLLSYVPEWRWRGCALSEEQRRVFKTGREYMIALKRDSNQPDGLPPICDSVAKWCADSCLFSGFFSKQTILVPVPGSALTRPDTLWVPQVLANSLVRYGLGEAAATCLLRVKSVPKSATSRPKDRATPSQHYKTMEVRDMLIEPKNILLVDDIVTRGAAFLGAAWRVRERYPNSRVQAFATMRTVSNGNEFVGTMDPKEGIITPTADGHSLRRP